MSHPILAFFEGMKPCRPAEDLRGLSLRPDRSSADPIWEIRDGERWLRNVAVPYLMPLLPPPGTAIRHAVVVAPGGAFRALSVDNEGLAIARWLAERGVAAFVLMYRLLATPPDYRAFLEELARMDQHKQGQPIGHSEDHIPPEAIDDGRAAIALIRECRQGWNLDGAKIGVLGFSAGGILAIALAASDESDRPDFAAAIYPSLDVVPVMPEPPPLFLVACGDDPLFGGQDFGIVEAWNEAGGNVALHAYARGGHGFGMRQQGLPCDDWPERFLQWLRLTPTISR